MEEFDFVEYKKMVKKFQENDDPVGWCDSIYKNANGDHTAVFWADLEPNPYLVKWLKENQNKQRDKKAIVIGCGVGDDAEALSSFGYKVTAFDISPSAIELCKNRYKDSKVDYLVADLFDYPKEWFENFDLVYECNTIQILPGEYRIQARKAISSLLAKNGYVLVSCRSRNKGEREDEFPLALDKDEIDKFVEEDKLTEISFYAYIDEQEPPQPHFFNVYQK